MRKFLAELRRRRVLRVAGLYVVAAWIVIQAAGEGFTAWQIPEEALRYVWIGALVGFPIALVFGWYYDITSAGIVRTAPAAADETMDLSLHRVDYIVLAALLVIFAVIALRLSTEVADTKAQRNVTASFEVLPENSIAVLPFVNMSADPENDYFSDGISEELLHDLAQLADLHVAARTSAFYFKGKNENISSIAAQLGVRNILEGSVRKSGNKLRITAQLIDASNGYHIWSETYDRELGDIFGIQDDISTSVVNSLKLELLRTESDRINRLHTDNMQAYDAYLLGLQQLAQGTSSGTDAAIESFRKAVELDPEYALAYVGIADGYIQLSNYGSMSYEEIVANVEPAVDKALELDSQLGEAYSTLGIIHSWRGDPDAAEAAFKTAIELSPGYARTYLMYGIVLKWNFGKVEEALLMHQKALGLDPLSIPINMEVADDYQMLGRHDEALLRSKRVIAIDPDFPRAYVLIADMYWEVFAQLDEAVTWLQKAIDLDPGNPDHARWQGMIFADLGDFDSASYWIDRAIRISPERVNARWGDVFLQKQIGDRTKVLDSVNQILTMAPQNEWAKIVLAQHDVLEGEIQSALERARSAVPDLMDNDDPQVTSLNYGFAIDLAFILINAGERATAELLLQRSLDVIETEPRLGYDGFKIRDVEAYALLADEERALVALRTAVNGGWRYGWRYDLRGNPHLERIREYPRFQAIVDELEREMSEQLARVNAMKASGELPAPERPDTGIQAEMSGSTSPFGDTT